MSLSPDQKLISADDHMDMYVLPKDLWETRLPKKYRDQGPRVVDTDDGLYWQAEGKTTLGDRARAEVLRHLEAYEPSRLAEDVKRDLVELMTAEARRHGLDQLPARES